MNQDLFLQKKQQAIEKRKQEELKKIADLKKPFMGKISRKINELKRDNSQLGKSQSQSFLQRNFYSAKDQSQSRIKQKRPESK